MAIVRVAGAIAREDHPEEHQEGKSSPDRTASHRQGSLGVNEEVTYHGAVQAANGRAVRPSPGVFWFRLGGIPPPVASGDETMAARTHLSKTRYLAGLQCEKRLWLACHEAKLATPADAAQQAIFDTGHEIGRCAHRLFPGGVLVDEPIHRFEAALAHTQRLLARPGVPAIFEAAFLHDGVRMHADALERLPDGAWGLREVKSSTSVSAVHLEDVAIQAFVLRGCGLLVPSIEIIHVNTGYVRGEGEIHWERFFRRVDVTERVETILGDVPARVAAMHDVLALAEAPGIDPSPHCWTPYGCPFWEHCTKALPPDWIWHLPGLRADRFRELRLKEIEHIADIPDEFPLSPLQVRVRQVLRSGAPFVSAALADTLATLGPPCGYLDFETMNPAIPIYPGTRPYERIPFQWSLHRRDAAGTTAHDAFLADDHADPRRAFAEALIHAAGNSSDPLLVYSSAEATVIKGLGSVLPDLEEPIARLRGRLRDVLPVVRENVYETGFGRTFSLKAVAPSLSPGFGYGDLGGVVEGLMASAAFERIARGEAPPAEEARLRQELLDYCARDTQALVEVHAALRRLAART